jgi:hypothetical protein
MRNKLNLTFRRPELAKRDRFADALVLLSEKRFGDRNPSVSLDPREDNLTGTIRTPSGSAACELRTDTGSEMVIEMSGGFTFTVRV